VERSSRLPRQDRQRLNESEMSKNWGVRGGMPKKGMWKYVVEKSREAEDRGKEEEEEG
jgi:hypothetical protein